MPPIGAAALAPAGFARPQEEHLTPELERAGWQARTAHPVIRR